MIETSIDLGQVKNIEKMVIQSLTQNGIEYKPEIDHNGLLLPYPIYQADTNSYKIVHILIPKEILREAIK